jgi:Fatty acid desaturase
MRDAALAPYVLDLRRDPFHCWMEKLHVVPLFVLSIVLAVWGAVHEGAFLAASLVSWGIFLRTTLELHGTWLVNSAAHSWGSRRFQTRDDSTNNWWVALLTFGEGWHNNHHADPRCVRHGLAWYELDINWLCIHALHRIGLAKNLCLGPTVRSATVQTPVLDPPAPSNRRNGASVPAAGRAIFVNIGIALKEQDRADGVVAHLGSLPSLCTTEPRKRGTVHWRTKDIHSRVIYWLQDALDSAIGRLSVWPVRVGCYCPVQRLDLPWRPPTHRLDFH